MIRSSFGLEVFVLMEIYYGSGEKIEFPEVRIGRYTKDFSGGYCTNHLD